MGLPQQQQQQQHQQVHASVVSVHRAVPVEISCNESPRVSSGVLINNRVVLPPSAPHKKSYYVTLADDEEGTHLHFYFFVGFIQRHI